MTHLWHEQSFIYSHIEENWWASHTLLIPCIIFKQKSFKINLLILFLTHILILLASLTTHAYTCSFELRAYCKWSNLLNALQFQSYMFRNYRLPVKTKELTIITSPAKKKKNNRLKVYMIFYHLQGILECLGGMQWTFLYVHLVYNKWWLIDLRW